MFRTATVCRAAASRAAANFTPSAACQPFRNPNYTAGPCPLSPAAGSEEPVSSYAGEFYIFGPSIPRDDEFCVMTSVAVPAAPPTAVLYRPIPDESAGGMACRRMAFPMEVCCPGQVPLDEYEHFVAAQLEHANELNAHNKSIYELVPVKFGDHLSLSASTSYAEDAPSASSSTEADASMSETDDDAPIVTFSMISNFSGFWLPLPADGVAALNAFPAGEIPSFAVPAAPEAAVTTFSTSEMKKTAKNPRSQTLLKMVDAESGTQEHDTSKADEFECSNTSNELRWRQFADHEVSPTIFYDGPFLKQTLGKLFRASPI